MHWFKHLDFILLYSHNFRLCAEDNGTQGYWSDGRFGQQKTTLTKYIFNFLFFFLFPCRESFMWNFNVSISLPVLQALVVILSYLCPLFRRRQMYMVEGNILKMICSWLHSGKWQVPCSKIQECILSSAWILLLNHPFLYSF